MNTDSTLGAVSTLPAATDLPAVTDLPAATEIPIPDLTMRGMDDPHDRATGGTRTPTVGQLAARVREVAGRPADWWHLVTFDGARPSRVRLPSDPGIELWLTTWPPGHRTRVHEHDTAAPVTAATVTAVIGGELAEVILTESGATERPLRASRIRVNGGGHLHELANPGPAFAITLHARPEAVGSAAPDHQGQADQAQPDQHRGDQRLGGQELVTREA